MTDHDLEQRLRDWYAAGIGPTEPAPLSLRASVPAIPDAIPVPPLAAPLRRRVLLLAAAALLVALVAGTMAIGSGLVKLPALLPLPSAWSSPTPPVSASASASATDSPATPGLVAYESEGRVWIANDDGTGAHELLPDVPGYHSPIGWSPDGSRLVYSFTRPDSSGGLGVTDAAGSRPREYDSLCPVGPDGALASCVTDLMEASLSPDGTSVAYAINDRSGSQNEVVEGSAIAILNLATGQVTRLLASQTVPTRTPTPVCENAPYLSMNHSPTWSPDGRQLIFVRDHAGPMVGSECQSATLIADVDGGALQRIPLPDELQGAVPVWSPDGSMFILEGGGVYTSRADLTGITPVASGGISSLASAWTKDGRVVFIRWDTESGQLLFPCSPCGDLHGDLWIMDADGKNATKLEPTVPALTAAGCIACPYPTYDINGEAGIDLTVGRSPPYKPFWSGNMLWQP